MGTRSLTKVYNKEGKPICTIYRHMDGYPSEHGQVLADWLAQKTIWKKAGKPDNFTVSYGETFAEFHKTDNPCRAWTAYGNGCRGFDRNKLESILNGGK